MCTRTESGLGCNSTIGNLRVRARVFQAGRKIVMPCHCCEIENKTFGEAGAKANLKKYRRRGPAKQTRMILEAARSLGIKNATLLDVGGGIGTIHHELLNDIASTAAHVDASAAYLKIAKEEAQRLGHDGRVEFIHADFTDVAGGLPQADVVTLDRVVCCYPNFRELLKAASSKCRKAIALTYPRETWYVKAIISAMNLFQRLRRDPFRVFVHPVNEMESLLNGEGFQRTSTRRLFVWEMSLYRKLAEQGGDFN
ncbi:MAG: methyltransferase domain-containing protein [Anaerolineales bacterium]|nr:methyltransferase domain-containing protein [Anaerolineales bacterium]